MLKHLSKDNQNEVFSAARLLQLTFPWTYGDKEDAHNEVLSLCQDGYITYIYVQKDTVVGIIGARPQYGMTGWELHPLAVDLDYRGQGIATLLVEALEKDVVDHGGLVMYLGSDDEFDQTSLSKVDLFKDPFEAIKNIKNMSHHPYSFYQKCGYEIV
ncbi:MAG: GNAT family N-acetyltransferase, partial [Acholeplasmataceae bacterium]